MFSAREHSKVGRSEGTFEETDAHIWLMAQWSLIVYTETELYWWIQPKAKLIKHQTPDVVKWLISDLQNLPYREQKFTFSSD